MYTRPEFNAVTLQMTAILSRWARHCLLTMNPAESGEKSAESLDVTHRLTSQVLTPRMIFS